MNRLAVLRTLAWMLPLGASYVLIMLRRPTRRLITATLLGIAWNLWAILAVNVTAIELGWWSFTPDLSAFMGVPLELWAGWVVLWGAIAPLSMLRQPLHLVVLAYLWLDLIAMPLLEPLVVLNGTWLVGEATALLIAFTPGVLLFRWTYTGSNLRGRASLQVVCAAGLFLWLIPSVPFGANGGWEAVLDLPAWRLSLLAQTLMVAGSVGVRAVIEFVRRGQGTPIPYDHTKRLVTSGPYSYVRNPMQLSMVLVFALAGVGLWNLWLLGAAGVATAYSVGLAEWHENLELSERFGYAWARYRSRVRPWLPTFRPNVSEEATLLVAYSCHTCSSIGRWFKERDPIGLKIAPAEDSGDVGLRRVTYQPDDGPPSRGVAAIARALEHIHLGWAVAGWLLALPLILQLAQLIADVCGPTPQRVAGLSYDRTACDLDHPHR